MDYDKLSKVKKRMQTQFTLLNCYTCFNLENFITEFTHHIQTTLFSLFNSTQCLVHMSSQAEMTMDLHKSWKSEVQYCTANMMTTKYTIMSNMQ